LVIIRSICSSLITPGRPGRGSSDNPSNRCTTNRDRHFDTVARDTPSWLATSPIVAPSAHCNTIRDRSANACAVFRRLNHPTSADRSSPDNTTGSSFGLDTAEAYPVTTNYRLTTLGGIHSFLDYDVEIRKIICSTNAIESLNGRYRRAVRARGHFPTEQAALKSLVTRSLDPTGRGKTRWAMRWKPALNAFAITFEGRIVPSNTN
jgi:hypothetical protein